MDQLYNLGFLNPQFDLNSTAEWVMFQAPPSDRFSIKNIWISYPTKRLLLTVFPPWFRHKSSVNILIVNLLSKGSISGVVNCGFCCSPKNFTLFSGHGLKPL